MQVREVVVEGAFGAINSFDGVVDLDRVTVSPADRDRLDLACESGDHLHLNDAGYRAVAGANHPVGFG